MQKITPFLWFDGQAEQAMKFYVKTFKRSKIGRITRFGEGAMGRKGTVMTASFTIEGQEFVALNGGPHYKFTPAISFYVDCKTQQEVNTLWRKLSAGGEVMQCGWLTDKYGVSWQIIPRILIKLLNDRNPEKAKRVMQAMLKMVKIDIKKLKDAHAGN